MDMKAPAGSCYELLLLNRFERQRLVEGDGLA
jgi:hypothetical protein